MSGQGSAGQGGLPPGFPDLSSMFSGMGGEMPGGFPGMDAGFLQQLMQDPTIQRMTEAIASDPGFMEMAKQMEESMLSGGMGGLNLGGEDGGASEPQLPNVDPSKYMSAMQRVMGNPEFLEAAESLGRSLLTKAVDPEMASLMELFSNPAHQDLLKVKLEDLKSDPELRPVLEDIEQNGQQATLKYMNDASVMSKLGKKFQEAMADPEIQAQLQASKQGEEEEEDGAEGDEAAAGDEEEAGENTLFSLATAGDVEGLKELLKQESADVNERDEEGRTPLHFAAGYGEYECLVALLDAGADVKTVDDNDNTALHYAAGYGYMDTAQQLVDRGVSITQKNKEGMTAGEVAALNEKTELVELLEKRLKADQADEPVAA